MLKNIFYATAQNSFVWLSALYLLFLLFIGKATTMTVLFTYFLETLLIGVFNVLKLFLAIRYEKTNNYGFILFFIFHYGFFVTIQSIFAFALFSFGNDASLVKEPFNLVENYTIILQLEDIKYALLAILFTHVGKFFADFIQNKKYQKFTSKELMFTPYVRIFIQQFVVILTFFFIAFTQAGIIAAVLLITFRLVLDLIHEAIKENSKTLDSLAKK